MSSSGLPSKKMLVEVLRRVGEIAEWPASLPAADVSIEELQYTAIRFLESTS
jgi:hypothetical protein